MGRNKTGVDTVCPSCGKSFYRPGHNIRNNTKKFCSIACAGVAKQGKGNPFYGKHHSPETLARITAQNRANPPKGTGPKKGIFKHTPEAKRKMSEALHRRWQQNRTDMLAYTKLGKNAPYKGINGLPRWKFCFTRKQKRDWIGKSCAYCKATTDLVIDHIIPVICGGINEKSNAQTLCPSCNRWKMRFVDRPLYSAIVGSERG